MELILSLLNHGSSLTRGQVRVTYNSIFTGLISYTMTIIKNYFSFFAQKTLLEMTINTLSECSQIGSLIMREENGETKEPHDEWDESDVDKNKIFSLIHNLTNRLLWNLSSQEVRESL